MENMKKWLKNHRRMLKYERCRAECRVEELERETDCTESIDLIDARWNLSKQENRQRRLDEEGLVLYSDRQPGLAATEQVFKLNVQERQWHDEVRREEQEEAAASVGRGATATAGRRAGKRANASAGAGKTAAAGAGKASLASAELRRTSKQEEGRSTSRSSGRSISRSPRRSTRTSTVASPPIRWQSRGRSPTSKFEPACNRRSTGPEVAGARKAADAKHVERVQVRVPRSRSPSRKLDPASSGRSPCPGPQGLTSKAKPESKRREAVSAKIRPMRTLARGGPPDLQGGQWVRVKSGWLTGRAQPASKEELESWGADVVTSLQSSNAGGGIAHGFVEAALSAKALMDFCVLPVYPICRGDPTAENCDLFARFVVFAVSYLEQGKRVVVHCRQGLHRTGVGIYLLLRLLNFESEQCLSMMEEMRPRMREEFVLRTSHRHLHSKAESIFADRRFKDAVKLSIEHLYEDGCLLSTAWPLG